MSQELQKYPRKAILFSLSTPGWENRLFVNIQGRFGEDKNQFELDLIKDEIVCKQEFEIISGVEFARKLLPNQVEDLGYCKTLKQLAHKVFASCLNAPNVPNSFLKKAIAKIGIKSGLRGTFKENGPCLYAIFHDRKSLRALDCVGVNLEVVNFLGSGDLYEWKNLQALSFLRYEDEDDEEFENYYLKDRLYPSTINRNYFGDGIWPPKEITDDDILFEWATSGAGSITYQDQIYFKHDLDHYDCDDDDDTDTLKPIFHAVAFGRHADEFIPISDYIHDLSQVRYVMGLTDAYLQKKVHLHRQTQKAEIASMVLLGREIGSSRDEILYGINQKLNIIISDQEVEEIVDGYDPFMIVEIDKYIAIIKSKMGIAYPDLEFDADSITAYLSKDHGFNRYCVPVIVASAMLGVKPDTVRNRFHKDKLGGFQDCDDQIYIWLDNLIK